MGLLEMPSKTSDREFLKKTLFKLVERLYEVTGKAKADDFFHTNMMCNPYLINQIHNFVYAPRTTSPIAVAKGLEKLVWTKEKKDICHEYLQALLKMPFYRMDILEKDRERYSEFTEKLSNTSISGEERKDIEPKLEAFSKTIQQSDTGVLLMPLKYWAEVVEDKNFKDLVKQLERSYR